MVSSTGATSMPCWAKNQPVKFHVMRDFHHCGRLKQRLQQSQRRAQRQSAPAQDRRRRTGRRRRALDGRKGCSRRDPGADASERPTRLACIGSSEDRFGVEADETGVESVGDPLIESFETTKRSFILAAIEGRLERVVLALSGESGGRRALRSRGLASRALGASVAALRLVVGATRRHRHCVRASRRGRQSAGSGIDQRHVGIVDFGDAAGDAS